jgi:hypothetical protein
MEDVMSRYLNLLMFIVIGLLVAGLGFAYATRRIDFGTFAFLGALTVALGAVVLVFLGRMMNPAESLEQTLYKNEHPTGT